MKKDASMTAPDNPMQAQVVKKGSRLGGCLRRARNYTIAIFLFLFVVYLISDRPSSSPPRALPTSAQLPTSASTHVAAAQSVAATATNEAPAATNTAAPPTATSTITHTAAPTATPTLTPTATATNTPRPAMRITFSSQQNGQQPVIGPIDIPTGIYRAIATTNDFMIADLETMSGTCELTGFGSLFNLSRGQATAGAKALLVSDGCRALISISNTQSAWTLELVEVLPSDAASLQRSYSSAEHGMQAVIGPIVFADGRYRVTATTAGFLIGDLETIGGSCDAGFMGLFNLSKGQADTGAQALLTTRDCMAFLLVHNTQEVWTIAFEKLE